MRNEKNENRENEDDYGSIYRVHRLIGGGLVKNHFVKESLCFY